MSNQPILGSYCLMDGNVLDVLPLLLPESFDSCFCDPPYGLKFMGKSWDHGVPSAEIWREVYRVLKPGAFLMAFGGTRTYHRLICAIEDAGFEIRDCLMWMYGQGFPKSLDISKAIDKELGNEESVLWSGYGTALKPAWEPIILAMKPCEGTFAQNALTHGVAGLNIDGGRIGIEERFNPAASNKPGTSSLNMSVYGMPEDVEGRSVSGRWPANVILSHTPWCVETGTKQVRTNMASSGDAKGNHLFGYGARQPGRRGHADENGLETVAAFECHPLCPVRLLDEQAGSVRSSGLYKSQGSDSRTGRGIDFGGMGRPTTMYSDSGGASRFFYTAKVSTSERNLGNIDCRHPTLKPISLCSYLSTLLLPPSRDSNSRRLLVPFSGAGSEMIGALLAGWDEVHGIEIDPQYLTWAEARISAAMRGEMRGETPSREGNQDDNQEGRQNRRKGRGRTPTLNTEALDVLGDILS